MSGDDNDITKFNKKRLHRLARAEWVDAWRIAPRVFVALYGALVGYLMIWFIGIGTYVKTECQENLLIQLLDRGMSPETAQSIACTIVDVVGGPTTATTVFVTTICGLATGIFAFYTNTGRDWSKGVTKWKWSDVDKAVEDLEQRSLREEIKDKIDKL